VSLSNTQVSVIGLLDRILEDHFRETEIARRSAYSRDYQLMLLILAVLVLRIYTRTLSCAGVEVSDVLSRYLRIFRLLLGKSTDPSHVTGLDNYQ
jgi:hypothetical protein